ncbi:MAG: peptide chain release factor N(5)-glutamine methyltransferase [Polaromonas sp.]|nr:peptide chain release factor N(5)-glutamine methyltransferase [Polaromonas sp.]
MNLKTNNCALKTAYVLGLERLEAQLLLLHVLARPPHDRAWLLAHDGDTMPGEVADTFQQLAQRRAAGEPLAYLVGHQEFFGLRLTVDSRVLVPRPDTETLVDWALDLLQAEGAAAHPRVLDLGTGSGAVALALAHTLQKNVPPPYILAVDACTDALAAAQANAARLALDVHFLISDWFAQVEDRFNLIVSNPPYIADADPHLAQLTYEPLQALISGSDGLNDLRRIIGRSSDHLHAGGWLLLEHGYDQSAAVRALLVQEGFVDVQSRMDLSGTERCTGGRWNGTAG